MFFEGKSTGSPGCRYQPHLLDTFHEQRASYDGQSGILMGVHPAGLLCEAEVLETPVSQTRSGEQPIETSQLMASPDHALCVCEPAQSQEATAGTGGITAPRKRPIVQKTDNRGAKQGKSHARSSKNTLQAIMGCRQ